MRVALVAGFFDPVREALQERFPKQIDVSSLIWIRQSGMCRAPKLDELTSALYLQLGNGCRDFLVIAAVLQGCEWIEHSINRILGEARSRYPDAQIEVLFERNATAVAFVTEKISAFKLPDLGEITPTLLRERLFGQKVLCVVMAGHTGYSEGLSRAGFPESSWNECFVEMVVPRGKNSNLMEVLHNKASEYAHLLYAWTGLRTLPSKVKRRYTGLAIEAPTAKDVVGLFKRWVLQESKK